MGKQTSKRWRKRSKKPPKSQRFCLYCKRTTVWAYCPTRGHSVCTECGYDSRFARKQDPTPTVFDPRQVKLRKDKTGVATCHGPCSIQCNWYKKCPWTGPRIYPDWCLPVLPIIPIEKKKKKERR